MISTHRASEHPSHAHTSPTTSRSNSSALRPLALVVAGAMTASLVIAAGATQSFGAPAPAAASVASTTSATASTASVVRRSAHVVSVHWMIRGRG
ncbi:MAG TPA: hypothetical protein VFL59_08115, partial [Candidatus Nanopelagicales bacterium]|nr:hypothetical protein [Candidatus Nanopelagicales bacterium]